MVFKQSNEEKIPEGYYEVEDFYDVRPYVPWPPLLEEGCQTCCRCSSKLPRDMAEYWYLTPKGYICVRCRSRS